MKNKRQELDNFLYIFVMPVLYFYVQNLMRDDSFSDKKKVFLSREGWFMEKAYRSLSGSDDSVYLNVSRSFLYKITSHIPEALSISLTSSFQGNIEDLLVKKFLFDKTVIKEYFDQSLLLRHSDEDGYVEEVQNLFLNNSDFFYDITECERNSYLHYLSDVEFSAPSSVLCDIGYSGSIQKLITLLLNQNTYGAYLIASHPGDSQVGENTVAMKGYLKEGVKLGDGYFVLDHSLFLECILTSPYGQFRGVHKSLGEGFNFYYGKLTEIQDDFEFVESRMNFMFKKMVRLYTHDISYSSSEIELIYEAIIKSKTLIPGYVRHIMNADDDVSGLGVVNPINIFS